MVAGSWLPRLPEVRDRLHLDLDTLGLTLAVGGLGALVGSSLSGLLVARLGSRRLALGAAGALYLALPLIAVAPNAPLLAGAVALLGLADAQADVGMNAVGVGVEARLERSVMTRFHGLWSLGTLAGSGLSALALLSGIGLGAHLLVISALGVTSAVAAGRLVDHHPARPRQSPRSVRVALGLLFAGGLAVVVEGAPLDWSALYLTDVVGVGEVTAGSGVILFTAGMLAGRFAGDALVDRIGPGRAFSTGVAVAVAALLLVTRVPHPGAVLPGFALWGTGISVALPVLYKLAGSHPSFSEGSGLAALTVGTRLGLMVAPASIGLLASASSLAPALLLVIGVAAAASVTAARLVLAGARLR